MKIQAIILLAALAACSFSPSSTSQAGPVLVASGGVNHFPFAYNPRPGTTSVHYSIHPDDVLPGPVDAGRVIGHPAFTAQNFYLSGIVALSEDLLYGASYIADAISPTDERVHGWTSADGGLTWQPRPGVLHLPEPQIDRKAGWGGILFHRRLHRLPGGIIGGTVYGGYARDRKPDGGEWYRTLWATSPDGGASWAIKSVIAEGQAGTEGYAEPVSAICADGRILVVMRTGPQAPLRWSRSPDNGASWSAPADVPGGFTGWDPDLLALSGGVVMSWGVTGEAHVAISQDCGDSWHRIIDFDIATSSGYTGLAFYQGRLILFTDRAQETEIWGYPVGISQ